MDRYNGREMGSRLARSVFEAYDQTAFNQQEDMLPSFYMPQGQGGVISKGIIYYHIKTTNPLIYDPHRDEPDNRKPLTCDNLDPVTGKG